MKSGTLKRALVVTLVYIGIFVLLVLVQFSRRGGFSFKADRLTVSASYARNEKEKIESVRIAYAGLVLETSPGRPLLAVSSNGKATALSPISVEKREGGVRLGYERGVVLELRAGAAEEGEGFSLLATAKTAGFKALRIPYSLSPRTSVLEKDGGLLLQSGGGPYALSLSPQALADKRITLDAQGTNFRGIALQKVAETPSNEALLARAPKDEAAFRQEIDEWIDSAWSGWSATRYDPVLLAWRDAGGTSRFSEKALSAYIAEAFRRGSSAEALGRMKPVRERYPGELSYLSVPFLGDTIRRMEELEAQDALEVKRLQALVEARDPSLFEKEDVIHWLMDRSPYQLAQDALRFAAELDPEKLTLRQAVGVLACSVESRYYLKPEENPFVSLGRVSERIAAAVRKTDAGLFLQTDEGGTADLRLSLLAGVKLLAYGGAEGKDDLVGLGQELIESVLGLADEQGFLPARAMVGSGAFDQRSGSLAPEEIYPLIADNPYYPREVSFYRDVAPGVWAWTCATKLGVETSPSGYVFNVVFPLGLSHFMTFYGIKPFTSIKLYGIEYSPDAQFEMYNVSGYLYRRQSGALYLKMRHKAEVEKIELGF